MTSTDDSRDSGARGDEDTGESSADVFVEPIRRRSTYTPPPQFAKPVPVPVPAPEPVVPEAVERPPAPAGNAIPLPPAWEFVVVPSAAPLSESPPEAPEAGRGEQSEDPGFMTPDEEAATLARHAPPLGQPWIPQRRSLPDDELVDELVDVLDHPGDHPGSTLDAIDALENEMRLREEEKQEYREWEDSMLAVGSPEALAAVARVRPTFTGIVVPPELTPTEAIPIQKASADDHAEPPRHAAAREAPADTPAPADSVAPADTVVRTDTVVTTDTGSIAAALFDAEEFTTSTIAGQNETAAALVSEAATAAAAAAQQPGAVPEPAFAVTSQPLFADRPASSDRPASADRPVFADQTAAPTGPELDFDSLLTGGTAGAADRAARRHRPDEEEPGSPVDDINAFFAAADAPANDVTAPPNNATAPARDVTRAPAAGAASAVVSTTAVARVSHVAAPARAPLFSVEQSGVAPTPEEYRVGRASRLFWLWFAANSSVVSIGFGALVFSLGMSLRQSIMAILAGVALSFIPLGLGTLAGKRSGQPAVVLSRASFGVVGNILPAVLAVLSRVFWGGVLLWLFASSIAAVLVSGGADGGLGYDSLVFLWLVLGAILAAAVAFFGYALFARVQLVISVLSGVLIVGFVALTADRVDVRTALTVADGPWTLVITGAVLVFSFVGLVWANSSSDLARYQRGSGLGSTSMLWASFGTALPTFLLIAYGALLAASDPALAAGLVAQPIDTLASILPSWYPLPLIAATALSLLSGVIVIVYSGAFALQGVGVRLERQWSTVVVAVLLLVLAAVFSLLSIDLTGLFRDLATTLAVPVAAWVGIVAADTMIRSRKYHTGSLLRRGGLYPDVNWVNLGALVGITLLGFGLTTASVALLSWQGYLFALGGVPLDDPLAASDLGVLVALVLGILTPIVSGIPAIRRQETATV